MANLPQLNFRNKTPAVLRDDCLGRRVGENLLECIF